MSSSSTITRVGPEGHDYSTHLSPLAHPGEHLREDYLPDYGLTAEQLATAMGLSDPLPVQQLVAEARDLDADLALRLGKVFQQSAQFWMGLQNSHDISKAAIAQRDELARIQPLVAA